jgi:hypothetical protein
LRLYRERGPLPRQWRAEHRAPAGAACSRRSPPIRGWRSRQGSRRPPRLPLARLADGPMAPGRLVWIGLRPARRAAMAAAARAWLGQDREGDRYSGAAGGARQITLIAQDQLAAIANSVGRAEVEPQRLRRSLVVGPEPAGPQGQGVPCGWGAAGMERRVSSMLAQGRRVRARRLQCRPPPRRDHRTGPGGRHGQDRGPRGTGTARRYISHVGGRPMWRGYAAPMQLPPRPLHRSMSATIEGDVTDDRDLRGPQGD